MEAHSLTDSQWAQYEALLAQLQPLSVEERTAAVHMLHVQGEVEPLVLSLVAWRLRRRPDLDHCWTGMPIGTCTLEEKIGAGGMGVVYQAQQHIGPTSRPVAVKLIHPTLLQTDLAAALARFRAELHALVTLEHEGIARIYDGGISTTQRSQDPCPYIVMELVRHGQPLTTYAQACHLSLAKRLDLFLRVCHAVRYAHERRIVHRDLKPTNILVNSAERPVVIDFGLARAYDALVPGASMISGTPTYMSPEQVDPTFGVDAYGQEAYGQITYKSDVYALGVVLYELLTGHRPYEIPPHSSTVQWRQIITQVIPPPVSQYQAAYQGVLDAITAAALAKRPQDLLALDILQARLRHYLHDLERASVRRHRAEGSVQRTRRRLLEQVRRIWITGFLEPSLSPFPRLELSLEPTPDAVEHPFDLLVQRPTPAPRPLPMGTPISHMFDAAGQALLILGEPGAGKTTLLLELTRVLLDRAAQDAHQLIPVVFHLSSWAERRLVFTDWLMDELTQRYAVPRKRAQAWVQAERILPVLDGLDEVAAAHRAACVETLNTFLHAHGLVPVVVCCRAAEYTALPVRLRLASAVRIHVLSRPQVHQYVAQAGAPLAGLQTALHDDDHLWELLNTPLLLRIAVQAYHGRSAEAVPPARTVDAYRRHLFTAYTEAMFDRRGPATPYSRVQTEHWLTWLAQTMQAHDRSIVYVESIQPDWLPGRRYQRRVTVLTAVLSGLSGGLVCGLAVGLLAGLGGGLSSGLRGGLLFGLIGGGYLGLFSRLSTVTRNPFASALGSWVVYRLRRWWRSERGGDTHPIRPVETVRWSWSAARQAGMTRLRAGLRYGPWGGLGLGLLYLLVGPADEQGPVRGADLLLLWLGFGLAGLILGLYGGLLAGLASGLRHGFRVEEVTLPSSPEEAATTSWPNEGIWRSLRSAVSNTLRFGLIGGLLAGLFLGFQDLRSGSSAWLETGLGAGFLFGLISGLSGGLCYGGYAFLHHWALRVVLWHANCAPFHYVRFLDYAAARILLRKVGGGYVFIHRLLLEYFAARHHPSAEP